MSPVETKEKIQKKEVIHPAVQKNESLPWAQQLRMKFRANVAHTFILTGNVRDMVDNRQTLDNYLTRMFLTPVQGKQNFDIVVQYDRANGLRFPLDGMEAKFSEVAGLNSRPSATANVFAAGNNATVLPRDPGTAFEMVERVLKAERKNAEGREMHTLFICDYAESLFPAGTWASLSAEDRFCIVKMLNWAKDPLISRRANAVVLIADSSARLHDMLTATASRMEMIEILLPNPDDRLSFIEYIDDNTRAASPDKKSGLKFEEGFDCRKFAHLTAGLKKLNIEDVKLTAHHLGIAIGPEIVKQRKREIYKQEYQSVLEVVEPEFGFEVVGGMQWLKDYCMANVIEPMMEGDIKRCPMGVLMVGASGTGKTVFAQALAKLIGMNMVNLDVGKLLGSLVGESEHNTDKALLAIKSLFPVLVWMDELDQAISRGSHGDSGVSNRIFKKLLEFMSDGVNRGRVLFVGATNRPDMMDPALKRRGRFDKIIPFLPPDESERETIFPAIMRRYGYEADGPLDFKKLSNLSKGWVGSDIEAAMVKAYEIASRNSRDKLTQADCAQALRVIMPAGHDVKLWTNLALVETSDIELLPPQFRDSFDKERLEQETRRMKMESLTYTEDSRRERDVI